MSGGTGFDEINGGAGRDEHVFAEAGSANADNVWGFVSGTDRLSLDDAFFTNAGAAGSFAAGDERFRSQAGATSGQDATDRVIYDPSTGRVFYDSDGMGGGVSVLVARLVGAPALAATDISVV
jgi:Ca2+-binding RTX toxin-like protein